MPQDVANIMQYQQYLNERHDGHPGEHSCHTTDARIKPKRLKSVYLNFHIKEACLLIFSNGNRKRSVVAKRSFQRSEQALD